MLGNGELIAAVRGRVPQICKAASEGLDSDGALFYERKDGHTDKDKHWWVQAECVVGFFNLWQLSGDAGALEKAQRCWEFIKDSLVDKRGSGSGASNPTAASTVRTTRPDSGNALTTTAGCVWN